ncbi:MAG: acetate kinase [Reichenbachiella sp.]
MKILVLNSGSSSLKYQLLNMPEGQLICSGLIEKIGETEGELTHKIYKDQETEKHSLIQTIPDHRTGLELLSTILVSPNYGVLSSNDEIDAVGHRIVHGGESFSQTTIIDDKVKNKIKELYSLAPLHNPANLEGVEVAENVFKKATQLAVFDTAFHSSIPEEAYRFAIPEKLYKDYGVRVYGFHGTSHRYVSKEAIRHLGLEGKDSKIITVHLGNGCSMAAVKNGQCIDTSMGLGPLGGLIMGTRSGDIDPSVIFYLVEQGFSLDEVKNILNKQSGMKGLTGNNDLRNIHKDANEGNTNSKLSLEMYVYRIKKYIGSYMAALGGIDAIVFTAGVGENDAWTRQHSVSNLSAFGIEVDESKNNQLTDGLNEIQKGVVKVLVIPTNEELEIANQSYQLING